MNHKWKRSLLVLLLVLAMVITLPVARASATDIEEPVHPVDPDPGVAEEPDEETNWLEKTGSLTVFSSPIGPNYAAIKQDLDDNGDIVIDYYLVATAKDDPTHGLTYTFEPVEGFSLSGIDTYEGLYNNGNGADWAALAQSAAGVVLADGYTDAPTATKDSGVKAEGLAPGLYLVIAHADGAKKKDYVKQENGVWSTTAMTDEYIYTFAPELIALPSTVATIPNALVDENTTIKTSDGEWVWDLTAYMKPSQEMRYGELVVTKTLDAFDTIDYDGGKLDVTPVTFVFSIKATKENPDKEGEIITYVDKVIAFTFTGADSKTFMITEDEKLLPVGAKVEVEEVYSGAGYELVNSDVNYDDKLVVPVEEKDYEPLTFTFENNYTNLSLVKGYGILNQYGQAADGNWYIVSNTGDSSTAAPQK